MATFWFAMAWGHSLLATALAGGALVGSASALAYPAEYPSRSTDTSAPSSQEQQLRRRVLVLIQDSQGKQLGSGVLIANATNGDWILTNRHVTQEAGLVCITTYDGRKQAGVLEPPPNAWQGLDLALVWLPRSQLQSPRPIAETMDPGLAESELAVVVAAGYPAQTENSPTVGDYREELGLLLPLLQGPLLEGYDLTYTASVQKGMSGGGLFVGDRLIGINGAHSHPLWPGQWQRHDGTPVGKPLDSQLELVALGLSQKHLQNLRLDERQPSRPADGPEASTSCATAGAAIRPTF